MTMPDCRTAVSVLARTTLLSLLVCLGHHSVLVSCFSGTELASLKTDVFHDYDQTVRPAYNITPVIVGVEMFILDISELDTVEMEFKMDLFLRQFWEDDRLGWELEEYQVDKMVLGKEEEAMVWRPDTFFFQEKTRVDTKSSFLRLSHTGAVLWSSRLRMTISCSLDLKRFPFDQQTCPVSMESFSMADKDILFIWHKGEQSVVLSPNLNMAGSMVETRTKEVEVEMGAKMYSSLVLELIFLRSTGSFNLVFLSSSLMVLISWIGFCLKPNLTTEKILLFLTPQVVLISIIFWIRSRFLLGVSYVSSIEFYLIFCAIMIFFSSVEFVVVYILNSHMFAWNTATTAKFRPVILDHISKIVFPVVFIIFQIWFWVSE